MKRIFTSEEIQEGIYRMAGQIVDAYATEPSQGNQVGLSRDCTTRSIESEGPELLVVGILLGCIHTYSDLLRAIRDVADTRGVILRIVCDTTILQSYDDEQKSKGVRIVTDLKRPVHGKDVLIVDDLVDTGQTMAAYKDILIARGVKSVKIAVLIQREREDVSRSISADFVAFRYKEKDWFVGYGMDHKKRLRELKDVWSLEEHEKDMQ